MKYKKTEDNIKALADQEPQTPSFDTEDPAHEKSEGADVEKREESNEKALDQSDQLTPEEQKELAMQCNIEYLYSREAITPKVDEWLRRLKLYNNQKREKDKVGDPLLFTIHQTVLASLYTDTLQVEYKAREEGDSDVASNLNAVALYDYDEMEKDVLDYEWDWDTLFFGRGLVEETHFDRNTMTPIPQVIDPTTFLRDPRASSVRGDRLGKGGMRFGGSEIAMTMWEIESNKAFFNINKIKLLDSEGNISSDSEFNSFISKARQARSDAQNTQNNQVMSELGLVYNAQHDILKWYTHYKGKKCVVYLVNGRQDVIRYHVLKSRYFPIFDRPLYPTAHDWDGTSIADITEDKQRLRSIIFNALGDTVKAELYPMYLYNTNKIKNRADLDFGFNKHIPVDGDVSGAVTPVNKANINSVLADYILQSLDAASQKATATPDIQQGAMSDQQRTLGELELISTKSSTRYSLSAKVFGWSEKRLWQHHYWMYKTYMEDEIDEKTVRIAGAWGDQYRKLTKENMVGSIDPDVMIVSKQVSEAETLRKQMRFEKLVQIVAAEPTANKRYALKKLSRLYNLTPDEIDRLLPPTTDELIATKENTDLSNNKIPKITDNDNHIVHLEMHAMAAETPAKKAHMIAHKEALRLMKEKPGLFPTADPQSFTQAGMTPPMQNQMNAQAGGGAEGLAVPKANQMVSQAAGATQADKQMPMNSMS